jgi:hypothetical protein
MKVNVQHFCLRLQVYDSCFCPKSTSKYTNCYSFLGLQLSDDFEINVVVLSLGEADHRSAKGSLTKHHVTVHGKFDQKANSSKNSRWLVKPIEGDLDHPALFNQKCLVVSFIMGYLLHEHKEKQKFDILYSKPSLRSRPHVAKKMCSLVSNELEKLSKSVPRLQNDPGPYDLNLLNELGQAVDMQCVVYFRQENTVEVFPRKVSEFATNTGRDQRLAPIYLLVDKKEQTVGLIKNIHMYYNLHGKICELCGTHVRSYHSYEHVCKINNKTKLNSCKSCRRPLWKRDTYENKYTLAYCKERTSTEIISLCPKCNVTLYNSSCVKAHNKVCRYMSACLKCKKVESVPYSKQKCRKTAKDNHDCNMIKCLKCYSTYERSSQHRCLMKSITAPKQFNNIGTIVLMFQNSSWNSCLMCNTFDSILCKVHEKSSLEELENDTPCMAAISMEVEKREHFVTDILPERAMFNLEHITQTCDLKYLPESLESLKLWTDPKEYRFGRPLKDSESFFLALKALTTKNSLSLLDKTLLHIFQKATNHCFIVDSYQSMSALLTCVLENNFQPEGILTFGTKVRFFKVRGHCTIEFVCRLEYLSGSLSKLAEEFLESSNFVFAPSQLIHSTMADYNGEIPHFDCFKDILDTSDDIRRKKKFYEGLSGMFSLKRSLQKAAAWQAETLLQSVVSFVKMMLELQCLCLDVIKPKVDTSRLPMLGPFTSHVSLAHFSYSLLRFFSDMNNVICLDHPSGKRNATSKPECAYTFFMAWRNPACIHALSHSTNKLVQLFGQSPAIPDLLIPATTLKRASVHFFNGCVYVLNIIKFLLDIFILYSFSVHGHSSLSRKCQYTKQDSTELFGKTSWERLKEFETKCENFKLKHPEYDVKVIKSRK